MSAHLLLIDDDVAIRRVLRTSLVARDYRVSAVGTGMEGLDLAREQAPDLILLDLGLPDMEGREVCLALREISQAPILVISARMAEDEKVALLDAGANDYVVKPYGTAELLARIRAALRTATPTPTQGAVRSLGDLRLDLAQRQAWVSSTPVAFTPTEWAVLEALLRAAGRTATYAELCRAVWGPGSDDRVDALHRYLSQIRAKVAACGGQLPVESVAQFGYRIR